jgi:hypothetical protein
MTFLARRESIFLILRLRLEGVQMAWLRLGLTILERISTGLYRDSPDDKARVGLLDRTRAAGSGAQ